MESDYEVLGVSPDADRDAVRRAYRTLMKVHHPDLGGSREQFLRIKEAYENVTGEGVPGPMAFEGANGHRRSVSHPYDPSVRDLRRERYLSVAGTYVHLSLRGLVHDVDLGSLLGSTVNTGARRTVAFFQFHNTSDRVLRWQGRTNTNFGGDDGFLYEASSVVTPRASELPAWWCGVDVDVPPGRAIDGLVIAQKLPDDVTIENVVYTQQVYDDDEHVETERYLFEIKPTVRETLDVIPSDFE